MQFPLFPIHVQHKLQHSGYFFFLKIGLQGAMFLTNTKMRVVFQCTSSSYYNLVGKETLPSEFNHL